MERRPTIRPGVIPAVLVVLLTVGIIGMLFYLLYMADKTDLRDLLLIVVGALVSNFNQLVAYFTGSTSTSEQKNALLAHSTPVPRDPVTVTTTSEDDAVTILKAPNERSSNEGN